MITRDDDELPPTPLKGMYDNEVDDASSDARDRIRSAVLDSDQLATGTPDATGEFTAFKRSSALDVSSTLLSNLGSNPLLAPHGAYNGSVAAGFDVKPPLPTAKHEKPATTGDAGNEASTAATADARTTNRSKLAPPSSQLDADVPISSSSKRNVIVLQSETTRQGGNNANSGGARGSGRGLSLLAARRIHSLREVGIETTRMAGFLHKKARTSFASRYQRRWFVLKRGTLLWFNAPGNANALGRVSLSSSAELVSTGTTKFAIYARPVLEDSSRQGSHAHSPSISPNGGRRSTPTPSSGREGTSKRKPLLELMAPEETAKDMWLQALQTEIDERVVDEMRVTMTPQPDVHGFGRGLNLSDAVAVPRYLGASAPSGSDTCAERAPNESAMDQASNARSTVARDAERQSDNVPASGINAAARNAYFKNSSSAGSQAHQTAVTASRGTRRASRESTPSDIDIATWIEMLNLPSETTKMFKQAGYNDVRLILEMGLNDEDLDFIGVTVPLHRRLLKDSVAEAWFTPTLQSKVVDYRICGSVALYAISSRYKYRRSTLHLRYANFVTLYAKLRAIDREKSVVHSASHEPLPKLPGSRAFVDQKGPLFLEQRRNELDEYLQKTISIARRDERLEAAVLSFLELADGGERWPSHFGSTLTPSSSVDGKTEPAATPRSVNLPTTTAASRNRVSHIVTPAVPVD